MDTFSKTALYAACTDLPPLVAQAVALANHLGFILCCTPAQGELLRVLARGRAGGVIAKPGQGAARGSRGWQVPSARRPSSSASKLMPREPPPAKRSLPPYPM
jgi:hypothetical protein